MEELDDTLILVYVTFDSANKTWNVMQADINKKCLFYSESINEMEYWLDEHKEQYREVALYELDISLH